MKGTLRNRAQFQRVYELGRKAFGAHMVVFRLCAPELDPDEAALRFAVVASRKVGDAVRRNRAKRLLREALRAHGSELRPAQWLVIVARKSLSDEQVGGESIRSEMSQLLQQLDALAIPSKQPSERETTL